jgi:hypothetical protein
MKTYYFTLSQSQGGPGCVEVHAADWHSAREVMVQEHGPRFAFQYESLEEVHPLDREILATYTE